MRKVHSHAEAEEAAVESPAAWKAALVGEEALVVHGVITGLLAWNVVAANRCLLLTGLPIDVAQEGGATPRVMLPLEKPIP
jgi:hypothetical protein